MIRVYQLDWERSTYPGFHFAITATFGKDVQAVKEAFDLGLYNLAATVDSDDKDVAYRLTNTIDRYWPENKGVKAEAPNPTIGGWRSTSVGDVMEMEDGRRFVVAGIGFKELVDEVGESG